MLAENQKRDHLTHMSNTKQYTNFQDVYGNQYGFSDYMSFATWFFNISRKVATAYFDKETFRRLQYEAANSKEARTKI